MDNWAKSTPKDRAALFNETANLISISPEIIEKDFWVCWILHQISQLEGLPKIIFKGGTSLSKVFKIIKRFSEDIDLVINRHELGFNNENDPANQGGSNLRGRTIESLKTKCKAVIADEFTPRLKAQIERVIGRAGWDLSLNPDAPDGDTVDFTYPRGIPDALVPGYVKRIVRLELGCRGDQVPCEEGSVAPYVAEKLPEQLAIREATVHVISPERTFWEKVTILHREYYRSEAGKPVMDRVFRHYHDVVEIGRHQRGQAAKKDFELLQQVVTHKQHFFREAAAHYELAKPGSLRLAPSKQLAEGLRVDFDKMREMYFGAPPEFDAVMDAVRALEEEING